MGELTYHTMLILFAVLMMFAAVLAKVFAVTRLHALRRRNAVAGSDLQQLTDRLKAVSQQKSLVKEKEAKLNRRKSQLAKKIARVQDALMEHKISQANRQQLRDHMRGKLIRPGRVGQDPEGAA